MLACQAVITAESCAADPGQGEYTVASYFETFAPGVDWNRLVEWPPDVFALANLVLDHTEGYRFVVAPPSGERWPPIPDWGAEVRAAARRWRDLEPPALVRRCWHAVTQHRDVPLAAVRSGAAWDLTSALLTLHAIADETCSALAGRRASDGSFEARAWALLRAQGSLARLAPARVRIVPKSHFSGGGITIRSLSKYLALLYESVDVRWGALAPRHMADRRDYNIVLVPWPLAVSARSFRPAPSRLLENMDLSRYGFFEFAPEPTFDCDLLRALLEDAANKAGRVDAVILPEGAVRPQAIACLEGTLAAHGATFLIAGVHQPAGGSTLGRNFLHFGVRTDEGWERHEQDKHHRWCLDEAQIRQYHLARSLPPTRLWWEAIEIRERTLHIIDVGGGLTTAPMVCEDLARLDEVADLVRRIGPSLVVAVLLDGPQLASRWPCRYSSVITDDPGSVVLTLTSYGMAARCRPPGSRSSRVVAHWNSRSDGLHELELAPGAAGLLVSATVEHATLWTADGRCHHEVPRLQLADVQQLSAPSARSTVRPRAPSAGAGSAVPRAGRSAKTPR